MGFYQYRHLFGDTGKESIAKQIPVKKRPIVGATGLVHLTGCAWDYNGSAVTD